MDDNYEEFTNIIAKEHILDAIKKFGIEGTLEKIETLYSEMPTLKEMMIKNLWEIVKGK